MPHSHARTPIVSLGDDVQAKEEILRHVMTFCEQECIHSFDVDSSEKLKLMSPHHDRGKVLQELLREPEHVHYLGINSSKKLKVTSSPHNEGGCSSRLAS